MRSMKFPVNLSSGLAWNTHALSWLMLLAPSCYLDVLDKLQRGRKTAGLSLGTSLESFTHRRNVVRLSLYRSSVEDIHLNWWNCFLFLILMRILLITQKGSMVFPSLFPDLFVDAFSCNSKSCFGFVLKDWFGKNARSDIRFSL